MEVVQSIWLLIRSEDWWVISSFALDKSCSAGSATWWRKMNVDTRFFANDVLHKLETFWFQKVELQNWSGKLAGQNMVDPK